MIDNEREEFKKDFSENIAIVKEILDKAKRQQDTKIVDDNDLER